ncbi:MAG: hypothetical protein M0Z77_09035 [Thermoplasmatales archaeon]|nr:hypothetical protein [Thermoplasmatales archaeon]
MKPLFLITGFESPSPEPYAMDWWVFEPQTTKGIVLKSVHFAVALSPITVRNVYYRKQIDS